MYLSIVLILTDGSGRGLFAINSTTGVITVNGTLDRESQSSYNLIVLATNDPNYIPGPGPYDVLDNISLKEVMISLLDVDDNGPYFPQDHTSACKIIAIVIRSL